MNIKWDADTYTNKFSFVHEYGNDVLDLIHINKGDLALDLGCGNGALTKRLSDMGLNAFGLDASPELLKIARENYPELDFRLADAVDFRLQEKVDVVFSNAVFHWIDEENQAAMLRCIYEALNKGGQFVFEFGGKGNHSLIHQALEKSFKKRGLEYRMPFYFPTIGQYASLLENTGFKVVCGLLFDRPTELKGGNGLYDFMEMFIKAPFTGMSINEKKAIMMEAEESLKKQLFQNGKWYADYVRIRCKALK